MTNRCHLFVNVFNVVRVRGAPISLMIMTASRPRHMLNLSFFRQFTRNESKSNKNLFAFTSFGYLKRVGFLRFGCAVFTHLLRWFSTLLAAGYTTRSGSSWFRDWSGIEIVCIGCSYFVDFQVFRCLFSVSFSHIVRLTSLPLSLWRRWIWLLSFHSSENIFNLSA